MPAAAEYQTPGRASEQNHDFFADPHARSSSVSSLEFFNHRGQCAQGSSTGTRARKQIARNTDGVTILDGDDHAEQNQGRKRDYAIQCLILTAIPNGRGHGGIGRCPDDQFAQLADDLRACYALPLPMIWTRAGPFSILTGGGETGSASGKNRSSLCR